MKVLVTTHAQMFRTPDGNIWTTSVYGYEFFRRYLDVFEEVRLVTRMKNIEYKEIGNKIKVNGPKIDFFPLPYYHGPWEYASQSLKIRKALYYATDGCDCAILRIPDQLGFQIHKRLKKKHIPCAIEVVAHSWDLYAPRTIKTILRPLLRIVWDVNQKKLCRKANGVSYVTKKYIQKRYPAKITNKGKRFETFYTSADLSSSFIYEPRNAQTFNKKVINLVHVSGINNSAKGHYDLLHALSIINDEYKNYKITFVGGGTMLDYYRRLSNNLGLNNKVRFTGHISTPDKIAEILKKSDIFVLPSMTEGLPRVLLEAMASGLPCIATNVGGISELLSPECLINPGDIEALADKIVEFGNNTDLLEVESCKNYQKIINEYIPEKINDKRSKFYLMLKNI